MALILAACTDPTLPGSSDPVVTSVTVNPASASVAKGNTQQFNAEVSGDNSPAQTVAWTVEGGVTGTNISSTGLLTVAAGESAAALTVRATSTVDTGKSGTAAVTVTGGSSGDAVLQTIAVTTHPAKTVYTIGETLDLTGLIVTGTYSDGTTKTETVSASDVSGYNANATGSQTLAVTVGSKTETFTVVVYLYENHGGSLDTVIY